MRGKLGHSVREWSVWKRYSDFALVDAELRKQLGWLMKSIKFPPKKTFGNLQPEFMEKRRLMLDEYISMVVSMKNVADFENHRSSNALRALIEFDKFKNADAQVDKNVVVATEDDNDAAAASSNKAGNGQRLPLAVEVPSRNEDKTKASCPVEESISQIFVVIFVFLFLFLFLFVFLFFVFVFVFSKGCRHIGRQKGRTPRPHLRQDAANLSPKLLVQSRHRFLLLQACGRPCAPTSGDRRQGRSIGSDSTGQKAEKAETREPAGISAGSGGGGSAGGAGAGAGAGQEGGQEEAVA